ncbi:unnamed protein product [Coffea canephora]|uniref:DH200=94 genomic scaffold, scaffold_474 n=1 Tax=Coffea canephora TaxID=49390 RepID=A0A068VFP8_COFCA|nr:unnamed protein product [Coffea canephora]
MVSSEADYGLCDLLCLGETWVLLKFQHSKCSVVEEQAGWKLRGLRVLNTYWIHEDGGGGKLRCVLCPGATGEHATGLVIGMY